MSMPEKYDGCEHCGNPRLEGESLSFVDCWVVSQLDGRRRPSYWLVCSDCYDKRQQWCDDAFPDICESCGLRIPDREHYFEKEYNQSGEKLVANGLAPDEDCRIICEACYHRVLK